ncbi:hypothetical protein [Paenirhodobacter populi]|uniref:hypothetical protein n=1 Tax=Paenirhodobacter populi TaxID=2306993 RepID=UPI0019D4316C|nr:hypothetical protein [Sinirhodobacter populi]
MITNIRIAAKVLPDGGRIISIGSGLGLRNAFPGTADCAAPSRETPLLPLAGKSRLSGERRDLSE